MRFADDGDSLPVEEPPLAPRRTQFSSSSSSSRDDPANRPRPPTSASGDIEANSRRRPEKMRDGSEPPEHSTVRYFSPLKDHLLRLMHSRYSATCITHRDTDTTSMLIMLDLFRAVIECWIVHIEHLRVALLRQTTATTEDEMGDWDQGQNKDWSSYMHSIPRDLGLCIDYVYSRLIEAGAFQEGDGPSASAPSGTRTLRLIKLDTDARMTSLVNALGEITDTMDRQFQNRAWRLQEQQQQSVAQLALLAAVFLPISLAASLLSMSTRAADLGPLWYDYFGTSAVLVSIVLVVHMAIGMRLGFRRRWQAWWRWAALSASRGQARIGNFNFDVEGPRHERFLGTLFPTATGLVLRRTMWWVLFRPVHLALFMAVPVSFIVGMFRDLDTGLWILGISAVVWAGLVLLLVLLRLWHWVRVLKKSLRGTRSKTSEKARRRSSPAVVHCSEHLGHSGHSGENVRRALSPGDSLRTWPRHSQNTPRSPDRRQST